MAKPFYNTYVVQNLRLWYSYHSCTSYYKHESKGYEIMLGELTTKAQTYG